MLFLCQEINTVCNLHRCSQLVSGEGIAKPNKQGVDISGPGAAFLIAACLHWKCCDQIQGGFQVEKVSAAEIVSEMRQAAEAICNF
jgi:predicted  nucleic acid-binding Zn ribbon protein